jgi:hypothetical protein
MSFSALIPRRGLHLFASRVDPRPADNLTFLVRTSIDFLEHHDAPDAFPPNNMHPGGWQLDVAYAGYQLNGAPDLYVYRKTANPTIEVTSEESLEEWRGQKRALDLFLSAGSGIMTGPSKRMGECFCPGGTARL